MSPFFLPEKEEVVFFLQTEQQESETPQVNFNIREKSRIAEVSPKLVVYI